MEPMTYKEAGVDTKEGQRAVQLMKEHVQMTFNSQVLADLGGFGGLFALDLTGIAEPVLVSGTDGVGTKLKLAFELNRHDTIGEDCVAMCVNDILCQGAKPLFFLDYIATGKLQGDKIADIVKGVAEGCKKARMALIGGETAEMPGFYAEGEYDIAGFVVGLADRKKLLHVEEVKAGDSILALSSNGFHSNGYSLVRRILATSKLNLYQEYGLGEPLGEALLRPTRIYAEAILHLFSKLRPRGIAHITGGGFYENIPRILPHTVDAILEKKSLRTPPVCSFILKKGALSEKEAYSTFNMGVGMVIIVDPKDEEQALDLLREKGEEAYTIGQVQKGQNQVVLC